MVSTVVLDVKYRQIPLVAISLPEDLNKLVKKILKLRSENIGGVEAANILGNIIDLDEFIFANIPGVEEYDVLLLRKFKEDIPHMLPMLEDAYNRYLGLNKISGVSSFYDLSFSALAVSKEYGKLLKRIAKLNANPACPLDIEETVGGIASLDVYSFSKLYHVGTIYVQSLINLQSDIPAIANGYKQRQLDSDKDEYIEPILDSSKVPEVPYDLSNCFLNRSQLLPAQGRLLGKLEANNIDLDIANLLALTADKLVGFGAFGEKSFKSLEHLQKLIIKELHDILSGSLKLDGSSKCLLVTSVYYDISLGEIDLMLLDDVEQYLFSLDEQCQSIALSRWGFHQKKVSLTDLAKQFGLTRERMRQKEKDINSTLAMNIRIHPKVLSQNIRNNISRHLKHYFISDKTGIHDAIKHDGAARNRIIQKPLSSNVDDLLPNLCKCFDTLSIFYRFLEILCQEEKNSILNIQNPKVKPNFLDMYFCENRSPVSYDAIVSELTSSYGYSKTLALSIIRTLISMSRLRLNNGQITPINLGRKTAAAHILLEHPNGLPWKDIANIVNKSGCCKTMINGDRLDSHLNDSEYIYQCGVGSYKHVKYLSLASIDIPSIVNEVVEYCKSNNLSSIHLNEYYCQASKNVRSIDYFDIRHLIRTFSGEYGLHFSGKSGVDAVGLIPNFKRVTQQDLIMSIMKKSETALTKSEIAASLRSKSIAHAAYYLKNMIDSCEIVRVDRMMYTTPEKAFRNVDTESILCLMDDILIDEDRAVEADIFRSKINRELNLSYPKYFYSALAYHHLNDFGWNKVGNLISYKEIPYKSLADAVLDLCNIELTDSANIARLSQEILITNEVALTAIYNWKASNA